MFYVVSLVHKRVWANLRRGEIGYKLYRGEQKTRATMYTVYTCKGEILIYNLSEYLPEIY